METDVIMEYEWLVYNMLKNFYGVSQDDLVQAGFLGLVKAAKNYNPQTGVKFSTYAYEYIYGEMYEAANGGRAIRVNKDAMRIYRKVSKVRDLLTQKYGRDVSFSEAAEYLGINVSLIADILNSLSASLSIEMTELNISGKNHLDDMILLKESLEKLSDVEKKVIQSRYVADMSQTETAKILGLSQVKVSRIEKKSKEKIREFMAA